jgi:NADPH-dependent curcumin reductase CurA
MTIAPSRQIVLAALPEGRLSTANFRLEEAERPKPAEGEVLLKVLYITLDASNRAWMQGPTYRAALRAGEVMYGRALAEVVESRAEGLAPGDIVFAETGGDARAPGAEARAHRAAHPPPQRLRHQRPHRLFRPHRGRADEGR